MNRRTSSYVAGAMLALLSGCASLMMDVKDVDKSTATIALKSGDTVIMADPDVGAVAADFGKEDAERLKGLIQQNLRAELKKNGIQEAPSSPNTLRVKVTHYEKGCGFCRGFFPLFGLGNSAVDGQVELQVAGRRRILAIQKTGQATGMSQMGDQTETNVEYLATVTVSNLTQAKK